MKPIKFLPVIALIALFSSGCEKILEEHPQSQIVPSIF